MRFNFFKEYGAFERDDESGTYRADFERMEEAMNTLAQQILTLQGDGDYEGAGALIAEMGQPAEQLKGDIERINEAGIPTDIIFEQGVEALGLH